MKKVIISALALASFILIRLEAASMSDKSADLKQTALPVKKLKETAFEPFTGKISKVNAS